MATRTALPPITLAIIMEGEVIKVTDHLEDYDLEKPIAGSAVLHSVKEAMGAAAAKHAAKQAEAAKPKTILVNEIRAKDTKRKGVVRPGAVVEGAKAEILPGVSIRLFGEHKTWNSETKSNEMRPYEITFKVGDVAEYHSYNLHYFGVITSITDKLVIIEEEDMRGKKHRMDLYNFNHHNWDFDLHALRERNSRTMGTI
jgi:hypothetical protein